MTLHSLARAYGGTPWDYLMMGPAAITVCGAALKVGAPEELAAVKRAGASAGDTVKLPGGGTMRRIYRGA